MVYLSTFKSPEQWLLWERDNPHNTFSSISYNPKVYPVPSTTLKIGVTVEQHVVMMTEQRNFPMYKGYLHRIWLCCDFLKSSHRYGEGLTKIGTMAY